MENQSPEAVHSLFNRVESEFGVTLGFELEYVVLDKIFFVSGPSWLSLKKPLPDACYPFVKISYRMMPTGLMGVNREIKNNPILYRRGVYSDEVEGSGTEFPSYFQWMLSCSNRLRQAAETIPPPEAILENMPHHHGGIEEFFRKVCEFHSQLEDWLLMASLVG